MELIGMELITNEEVKNLNLRLESLMDKAPSDAGGIFTVQRDKNGFRGLLKISSLQKKFITACSSTSLHELVERIVVETRGQIEHWKRERFIDDAAVAFST